MHELDDVDIRLFGVAAVAPAYDGAGGVPRAGIPQTVGVVLDLKSEPSGNPLDDMQAMLSAMTKELRERFQRFQSQRRSAEEVAAERPEETGGKLAQADAKAAIEAVSLIVRTLEKIDSLQRTILSERRDTDEMAAESADFDAVVAEFERRVEAKAQAYFERWKAEHEANAARLDGGGSPGAGGGGAGGP